MVRCPRHYCCGDVLISHQDIISLGLLVVCCSRALLLWWCVVLTPGHVLIGVVGGVLSKATTVVLVSCSHTRTLFDWSCWWCVVQGHYCCGDVLFSPPGHFFDWDCWWWVVPGHHCCDWCVVLTTRPFFEWVVGGGLSKATTVVVVCCSYHQDIFAWGCWRWVAPRPLLFWWCVVLTTKTLVGCSCCWWFWQRWAGARLFWLCDVLTTRTVFD